MNLDDELRGALERKDPPDGFAGRVLARVSREEQSPGAGAANAGHGRRAPRWIAAALAASLVIAAGAAGTGRYLAHQHAIREAEQARHDVELALRIASNALNQVNQKLEAAFQRASAPEINQGADNDLQIRRP